MVKAHPSSVKVIILLFSDREILLLLTLDRRRLHEKQAQPLRVARDAPRFSHHVQLGLACFACYLPGRRSRSKFRVLIRWRPHLSVRRPVWPDCESLDVCLDPLGLRMECA